MIDKNYLKQKIVIISFIGFFLLFVGNFLPLIEISSKTIDYEANLRFFNYEGKYILVLVVLAFLLLLLKEFKTAIVPIFIISLLLGYLLFHKSSIYSACESYRDMVSWGSGLYVLLIGNLLAYIAPIGLFLREKISIKITKK